MLSTLLYKGRFHEKSCCSFGFCPNEAGETLPTDKITIRGKRERGPEQVVQLLAEQSQVVGLVVQRAAVHLDLFKWEGFFILNSFECNTTHKKQAVQQNPFLIRRNLQSSFELWGSQYFCCWQHWQFLGRSLLYNSFYSKIATLKLNLQLMADVCSSGQVALGLQLLYEQLAQPCPGWLQLHLAYKVGVDGDKVSW